MSKEKGQQEDPGGQPHQLFLAPQLLLPLAILPHLLYPGASVALLGWLRLVHGTQAVPPQSVGDGGGHSEPSQVGQQEQSSQLVDGLPDEHHAYHQPIEQQQVQEGLGRSIGRL